MLSTKSENMVFILKKHEGKLPPSIRQHQPTTMTTSNQQHSNENHKTPPSSLSITAHNQTKQQK
eukprot:m.108876 g.108876  ORF g.108876 m.108876 type:complete len:64 (+) comp27912_c0_seq1:465-656(+)